MDKLRALILICFFSLQIASFAGENSRDYLYSEEYFDYLIECAQSEHNEQKFDDEEIIFDANETTITLDDENSVSDSEYFRLGIEKNVSVNPYSEKFKKPETKIVIKTSEAFGFVYDNTQFINKNYSDGRRITTGAEYAPLKWLKFAGGVETNYRDVDHNPLSRKLYFTPSLKINDKLSISFLNKLNVLDKTSDHDIGFNVSPLKSKALDFRMFAGMSNKQNGQQSQSASLYTNFYFY